MTADLLVRVLIGGGVLVVLLVVALVVEARLQAGAPELIDPFAGTGPDPDAPVPPTPTEEP